MPFFRLVVTTLALFALGACAAPPEAVPPPAAASGPYRLTGSDRLRIIVFGQENLSNSYTVDGSGVISMPLIGRVRAQGLTTAELESSVKTRLSQGYIREPSVSAEVEAFRPFFVLGEVAAAGQYPFIDRMTAQNVVAVAGGFTPRAVESSVEITRIVDGRSVTFSAPLSYPVRPGDTVTVQERFF
jgi:polysaccharide biosynthesis/export protein